MKWTTHVTFCTKWVWSLSSYSMKLQINLLFKKNDIGALHTEPWIWIRCRSGIRIQRPLCLHTASKRIWAACCAAWHCVRSSPAVQCAHSLRAVWSSRETTMNPDQGSGSSESGFSALVESPTNCKPALAPEWCVNS